MKQFLIDAGVSKMTMEACKRFKKKRDRQKEIDELDVNNIISSDAGKRARRRTIDKSKLQDSSDSEKATDEDETTPKVDFSKIKEKYNDLIASDDSETESKSKKKTAKNVNDSE